MDNIRIIIVSIIGACIYWIIKKLEGSKEEIEAEERKIIEEEKNKI